MTLFTTPVVAQSQRSREQPDPLFTNPLELQTPDPLLPAPPVSRPLSPLERRDLREALDRLRLEGEASYRVGNVDQAFQVWLRELRLRRVLGLSEEVPALGRVGAVAWQESRATETRVITQRLQTIQTELQQTSPIDYDLLLSIAQSYQQLRAYDPAVTLYQQLLAQTRQQQNQPRQQEILTALGQLQLTRFRYPEAATVFQELLERARSQNNPLAEAQALQNLAYTYQQAKQPQQAIAPLEQLVRLYQQQQQLPLIPTLQVALGDSYFATQRITPAAQNYQAAYTLARSQQQFGIAADALNKLAVLYQSINRPDDALTVYQILIDVGQQTYDRLGIMETLDQIGKIERSRGNRAGAISAFQQGLQLAQQLSYANRVEYFNTQIQQLAQ
jgi:tetratricopeptide (TPR) repeat protein